MTITQIPLPGYREPAEAMDPHTRQYFSCAAGQLGSVARGDLDKTAEGGEFWAGVYARLREIGEGNLR